MYNLGFDPLSKSNLVITLKGNDIESLELICFFLHCRAGVRIDVKAVSSATRIPATRMHKHMVIIGYCVLQSKPVPEGHLLLDRMATFSKKNERLGGSLRSLTSPSFDSFGVYRPRVLGHGGLSRRDWQESHPTHWILLHDTLHVRLDIHVLHSPRATLHQ